MQLADIAVISGIAAIALGLVLGGFALFYFRKQ